jgi:predicted transcriptional regulator
VVGDRDKKSAKQSARQSRVYNLTPEEEDAIRQGLAELDRGEWVSEQAMRAFWMRCGVPPR